RTLALNPDNRWLFTDSDYGIGEGNLGVWDLTAKDTAIVSSTLPGNNYFAAVSPDSHWLVTTSGDNNLRLWTLQLDELVDLGCRMAGRNLTSEEWEQHFEGFPYRKTCANLPGDSRFYLDAGERLANKGDIVGAIAQIQKAIELNPSLDLNSVTAM